MRRLPTIWRTTGRNRALDTGARLGARNWHITCRFARSCEWIASADNLTLNRADLNVALAKLNLWVGARKRLPRAQADVPDVLARSAGLLVDGRRL